MAKVFPTLNGDKCDSDYERAIIDDLIERGVEYLYEDKAARLDYIEPITRGGICRECGTTHVGKKRYRTLDLYLPSTDIIVEIKGKFPGHMRNLMRHMIDCNPNHDIRFMFMADTWLTKQKKRKLSDWANTRGIGYAVGDPRENPGTKAYGVGGIPGEWL